MKFFPTVLCCLLRSCALPCLALLVTGCPSYTSVTVGGSASVTGSGKPATESRAVGAFSKVEVSGAASLEVEIGNTTTLTVTTDDNVLPIIETKVEGDTLRIRPTQSYNSKLGVQVKITTPTLEGVAVSGAGNLQARGLDAKAFALDISGAGSAHLAGKAVDLDIQLSGAGSIDAAGLSAQNVKVAISGTAQAHVCATESLDASVSGAGAVRYTGHPAQVKQNVSGVGWIKAE